MNLIDAMEDPALFGRFFKPQPDGTDTWARWKALGACLMGVAVPDEMQEVVRHHTGRTDLPVIGKPFTEAALICGRRSGKSRMLATTAVHLAICRDYALYLAPGELATIAIIASDRRQARTIFRYVDALLRETPMLKPLIVESTAETITLSNRVQIEIATNNFRVTRGYTFAAVLLDEVAFFRDADSGSVNPDEELYRALRPGMLTIPGAVLLSASSPYRKKGILWNLHKRHFGVDGSRVLVWQASSSEMNSTLEAGLIAEAYDDDPAAASAEYGGLFREDLADFVDRQALENCVMRGVQEIPPVAGVRYKAFCDMSGGGADSMCLAVSHLENGVGILDLCREIRGPASPEGAVAEFSELLRSYNLRHVTGDKYAGLWPSERFHAHGIMYEPSTLSKSEIYQNLLPLLLSGGKVTLLDQKTLITQFANLERRTARGGRDSIDHPSGAGQHDDCSNATAGALLSIAGKPSNAEMWVRLAS